MTDYASPEYQVGMIPAFLVSPSRGRRNEGKRTTKWIREARLHNGEKRMKTNAVIHVNRQDPARLQTAF
jgi:hypothetical protein